MYLLKVYLSKSIKDLPTKTVVDKTGTERTVHFNPSKPTPVKKFIRKRTFRGTYIKGYLHTNTTENDLFLDPKYNKQSKTALHYKRKKRRIKSTGQGTGDIIVGGW